MATPRPRFYGQEMRYLIHLVTVLMLVLAIILAMVLAGPIVAWAEPPTPSPPVDLAPRTQPSSAGFDTNNIPSEKISQFVNAYLQVVVLIEHREGELQAAETESESLRIQQDIEAEAIVLIETAGLTRQEYLQLLGLANVDPEFGERVATLLQEVSS